MGNMQDALRQIQSGGSYTAPASVSRKTGTQTGSMKSVLKQIEGGNTPQGYANILDRYKNTPSYSSVLGRQKGPYAQAVEDNRNAKLGEKLKGITGGTLKGLGKTYAADIANAVATLGQTMGALVESNPMAQSLARPADALKSREQQRQDQDEALGKLQGWSDRAALTGQQDIQRAQSYTGAAGDALIEAGVGAGQSLIDMGLAATGVGAMIPLLTRVYGGATRQARQEGADLRRQNLYGVTSGALEGIIEKATGGVGKIYGAGAADDLIEALVGKTKLGNTGRNIMRGFINAQGEGLEEAISSLLSPAVDAIYKGNLRENYSEYEINEALRSYLIGAMSGGFIETLTGISGANRAANAVLDDENVQRTVENYWNTVKESNVLSKESRAALQKASEEMGTARQLMAIAKQAGVSTEAARALLDARRARDTAEQNTAQRAAQTAERMEINENISDAGQGNGLDGIGAGEPAGVFSEAAGEPAAIEPGDQSETGRGTENPESADLREVSPEELGITGAQNPVMLIDAERAGGSIADAADTVRSVGMEPVAFRGELRVGNASVNGYIEDGRIFFRTDAVDSQGREITAEQIVEHELFHAAAETDPQLVEDVKEVVRERMTEEEFDAMMADYETAYSKVQDFSDWTAEQIAEYLYQEIAADAYAGINYFNDAPANVEAARAAAPQVGQNQIDRSGAETRGPTTKNAPRFSLVAYDQNQKENWSKSKKIVVYENERQLLDFVNRAKTDKAFVSKMYFGKVDPVLAGEIRNATGFEMEGLNVTLRADNVRKIFKDHGTEKTEAPRGQRAITDADFTLIPAVIGDPDGLNESEYNGRPAVEFKKLINGSNVTVFAVDSGASSLDLFVQTMYAGKQKGSIANTANASALTQTPTTPVGIASTNNVSQTEAESNRNLPRASVEVDPNPWREAEKFSEGWAGERARAAEIREMIEKDPVGLLREGLRTAQTKLAAAKGDKAKKLRKKVELLKKALEYYEDPERYVTNPAWAEDTPETAAAERERLLEWSADRVLENSRKRRDRERAGKEPVGVYSKGEWETEQDRKATLEEEPPETESYYDEEAETFANEWARERIEQQKEMEYEAAVDQAKARIMEGKTGYLTGRNDVKYAARLQQNTRGKWFGQLRNGKNVTDTRRYETKEAAAEAVIAKAQTGDERNVSSAMADDTYKKEYKGIDAKRREADERVQEMAEEILGENPVENPRNPSPMADETIKNMLDEHQDVLDDDAEESAKYDWAVGINAGKGGNYADTLGRNLDAAAQGNKPLREKLRKVIEEPLRKAKETYTKGVSGKRDALYNDIIKELGIKAGSKESAAVQWYGEGQKNTESGDRAVLEVAGRKINVQNKVAQEYTLDDLKREFPDKWQDIVKAERWFRRQYDEYVDRVNESLKKVYPKIEEKAQINLAEMKAKAKYYAEQARLSQEVAENLEWTLQKYSARLDRMKPKDGNRAKIEKKISRNSRRLERAKKATESYREKQRRCESVVTSMQKEIDSGEIFRNKRLKPRKDYFHHMQESREGWGRLIDILTAPETISSDLSGQSEFTKPNAKFAGFMQRRTGELSKQDAVEGFLHYIDAAEYKIAFDPFIAEGRRQIKYMAEQTANTRNANKFLVWYTDYLNSMAGKTNPFDRWMQKALDRKSIAALKWLNNRVKANAVMGSFRSALSQFFNVQNGALYMPNPQHWGKGMKLLGQSLFGKGDAKAVFDQSVFLNERFLDNKMWRFDESVMRNPNRFASWMMGAGDELSAKLIWATAYEKGLAGNIADPIAYADDITMRSVGGRGVGDIPMTQSSEVVKLIAPFQLEVNNAWQAMKENFKAKNAGGFVAMAVVSWLMNEALRQALGYDVSFDIINALIEGLEDWDEEEETWTNLTGVFGRLTGEFASNVPMGAQVAQIMMPDETKREAFLGDSDPTRFGTGNIGLNMITNVVQGVLDGSNIADDVLSATLNLVLPWGGKQTEKIIEALQDFGVLPRVYISTTDGISAEMQNAPGSYSQNGRLRFPIDATPWNVAKGVLFGSYSTDEGIEYSESGAYTLSEELTTAWEELTALGMSGTEAYTAIQESRAFEADKDENGESISGSKKTKVLEYINGLDATAEQKDILLTAAGYDNEDAIAEAPWNVGMENDEFQYWAELSEWEQDDFTEFVEGTGMTLEDYAAFCEDTRDITADKDENGKSISGTKKKKIMAYIDGLDIPVEQKNALFFAAGYKESTLDDTPWYDGTASTGKKSGGRRRGGGKTKTVNVQSIATDLGLDDLPTFSAEPISTESAENVSAYEGIRKATSQLRKKNPWYELPTGNPELDEAPPAAARYFSTGKL